MKVKQPVNKHEKSKRKDKERQWPHALIRIGEQVAHLIVPDFRPLSKVLHDQIVMTSEQRGVIARDIERTRMEAMAAATQLMLMRKDNWQERPPHYFDRVKKLQDRNDQEKK